MFPSHGFGIVLNPNQSNDIRISVSFNFIQKGFENKMSFKYQVIKKALSFELANFIFNYFLLKRDAVEFMYENNIKLTGMFGTWTDKQVPNTYSCYADFVMETLLMKMLPVMKKKQD